MPSSGSTIKQRCSCGVSVKVPAAAVGRKARCPKCGAMIVIKPLQPAAPKPATAAQSATADKIRVTCTCGTKLSVPHSAAGRRARCPKCGQAINIPRPDVLSNSDILELDDPLPDLPNEQDDAGDTYRLSGGGDGHTAPYQPPPRPPAASLQPQQQGPNRVCPSCKTEFKPNTALCVECGVDLRTRRPLMMTRDDHLDHVYMRAEQILSGMSWALPMGCYPITTEAFGTRKPWTIYTIALVTIVTSLVGMVAMHPLFASETSLNMMLWTGTIENIDDTGMTVGFHAYQLITHAFLHADFWHLLGNLLFLIVLGTRVNALIGNLLTLVLYPLLGVAAAVVHMIAVPDPEPGAMLGASGAIEGLAGMYLILFPAHKVHMAAWLRWGFIGAFRFHLKLWAVRGFWVVLFYIAFDVFYTIIDTEDGVAHWAHIGGFVTGMIVATALLAGRLVNARGGDLFSVVLGRFAWPIIGTPNKRRISIP